MAKTFILCGLLAFLVFAGCCGITEKQGNETSNISISGSNFIIKGTGADYSKGAIYFNDTNNDSLPDMAAMDTNDDGELDTFIYDTNFDGKADLWQVLLGANRTVSSAWDLNGDAVPDVYDSNGDYKIDAWDLNGDGRIDQRDVNLDGKAELHDDDFDGVFDEVESAIGR
ncbi:MAG: hypothetical protein WC488_03875 [Candidatus Micrarchaeia archaeon]